ncbi:MAG: cell division protein FtsQ/DivIB [Prevotellaceae bacterium]|jgi:cell division protein FtsQ|nr:cell division protein FtsQ/DivIB [Prevotellaceae bacterium]
MRNKSLVIKIFIIIALTASAGYLLAAFVFFADRNDKNICRQVNVRILNDKELQMMSAKTVTDFVCKGSLNPTGKPIAEVKTDKIEEELLHANPVVKSAECYITPSGIMNIDILQRTPKFRVITGSEAYYVDTEGKTFPVSTDYSAYVPVVSGRLTKTFATTQLFDFVNFIEKNGFWNAQIEQIYVVDNRNIELVQRIGGGIIRFGDIANYELKFEKLQKLYTNAFKEIGWNHYRTIDLRLADQTDMIVCTKINN